MVGLPRYSRLWGFLSAITVVELRHAVDSWAQWLKRRQCAGAVNRRGDLASGGLEDVWGCSGGRWCMRDASRVSVHGGQLPWNRERAGPSLVTLAFAGQAGATRPPEATRDTPKIRRLSVCDCYSFPIGACLRVCLAAAHISEFLTA
jgi:hypothetical protein